METVRAVLAAIGFSWEEYALYGLGVALAGLMIRAYVTYLGAMFGARLFPRLPRAVQNVIEPPIRYLSNVAIALDILMNAVLAGLPRETVSGRLGRYLLTRNGLKRGIAKAVCRLLEWPDPVPGHCVRVYRAEQKMRETL